MGLIKEGRTVPGNFIEKCILGTLTLLDDIRGVNLPYAIKD